MIRRDVVVRYPICFNIFVVFLVLKLTNTIDWSWWWVTAPIWIPAGTAIGIALVVMFVLGIIGIFKVKES